jgi:hypothetical protein
MTKPLTPNLTSYDFLKCTALLLMVVDHLGAFFYDDADWMRAVGRLSAPIWLFLIGYAQSRDFSARMWIGIALLVLASFVMGLPMLPLHILATMLACRFLLDPVMEIVRRQPSMLYPICFGFFILTLPTAAILEYGSEVFLMVMLGYMTRHRETLGMSKSDFIQFALVATASHAFYQTFVFFSFPTPMMLLVVFGLLAVTFLVLVRFRPYEYPTLTAKLPCPLVWLIQLGGRRTLEFYVLHLIVFKAVSAYTSGTLEPFKSVFW